MANEFKDFIQELHSNINVFSSQDQKKLTAIPFSGDFPDSAIHFIQQLNQYIDSQKEPDRTLIHLQAKAYYAWIEEVNSRARAANEKEKLNKNTEMALRAILPDTGDIKLDLAIKEYFLLCLVGDFGGVDSVITLAINRVNRFFKSMADLISQKSAISSAESSAVPLNRDAPDFLTRHRSATEKHLKALILGKIERQKLDPDIIKHLKIESPENASSQKQYKLRLGLRELKTIVDKRWRNNHFRLNLITEYQHLQHHPDFFELYLHVLLNLPQKEDNRHNVLYDLPQFVSLWKTTASMGLLTTEQKHTLRKISVVQKMLPEFTQPLKKSDIRVIATDTRLMQLFLESATNDDIVKANFIIQKNNSKHQKSINTAVKNIFPDIHPELIPYAVAVLCKDTPISKVANNVLTDLNKTFNDILSDSQRTGKINAQKLQAMITKFKTKDEEFALRVKHASPKEFFDRMAEWDIFRANVSLVQPLLQNNNNLALAKQLLQYKQQELAVKITDPKYRADIQRIRDGKKEIWSTMLAHSILLRKRKQDVHTAEPAAFFHPETHMQPMAPAPSFKKTRPEK